MIYAISKELNEVCRVVETLILPVPPEQVELTRCLFCSYERRPLDEELGDLSNTAKNFFNAYLTKVLHLWLCIAWHCPSVVLFWLRVFNHTL